MRSRILLADDSITIQKVVNLTFADEGIDVVAVSNGEMAEKRLSEINPDLVLADIFMPGKNGYELCETIKKNPQFRSVPVLLLVGAFEPFDQGEAKRVRADGHLTKPFESRTLVETVRKLISGSTKGRSGALHQQAQERHDPLDTNPIEPPPMLNVASVPALPIEVNVPLSETSPLDLDYSAQAPAETVQAAAPAPEPEVIGQFEGPFVRTTGALSSVGPGAVHRAGDNGQSSSTPSVESVSAGHEPVVEAQSVGVPSRFGEQSNDIILDFETSSEPEPQKPVASELNGGESLLGLSVEAPAPPATEPVPVNEAPPEPPVLSPPEVLESASPSEPQLQLMDSVQTAAPEPPAASELSAPEPPELMATATPEPLTQQPAPEISQPVVEAVEQVAAEQESALASDEPLSDVLSLEPEAESPAVQPSMPVQDAPTAVEALPAAQAAYDQDQVPTASFETESSEVLETSGPLVVDELPVVEPEQVLPAMQAEPIDEPPTLDVLMPPPIVPSSVETGAVEWDEPLANVGEPEPSYVTEPAAAETADSFVMEKAAEPASVTTEEPFTASALWSEPEPRFAAIDTPIDIEATEVNESPVDSSAAEVSAQSTAHEPCASAEPALAEPEQSPVMQEAASDLAAPSPQPSGVSSAMIDEIVRRVVAELSDSVVREIAWEVVPDCVERVVTEITRDGVAKRV